jgi:hypothetical protein
VTCFCLQNLSSFAHNTSEYKAKAKQYNLTIQNLGRQAGYVDSLVMLLCAAAKACGCDVSIPTELYAYVCEGITCLWHRWTRASCSIVCLRTRAKVMAAAPAVTLFIMTPMVTRRACAGQPAFSMFNSSDVTQYWNALYDL